MSWEAEHERKVREQDGGKLVLEDTLCGIGAWRPAWLQRLATTKAYVLVNGVLGMILFSMGSYFVSTVSTLEKRFKIPSRTSGLMNSAADMGACCTLLLYGYVGGSGHKTRYVAVGVFIIAASCLLTVLPHVIYGPGEDALELTREHGAAPAATASEASRTGSLASGSVLCGNDSSTSEDAEDEDCSDSGSLSAPSIIFFLSRFSIGLGDCAFWTLGATYLDDNTPKEKAPLALGVTQVMRMVGPSLGFGLASITLSWYVDPSLHPVIGPDDPRWIGAWWIGYPVLAAAGAFMGFLMLLFPRQLPGTALRRRALRLPPPPETKRSFAGFWSAVVRLFRNKVMLFNTVSGVFFTLGLIGYWVFMPKYLETLYGKTASEASAITGSVGLVSTGLGIAAAAAGIWFFKPGARALAAWSVFVELIDMLVHCSWAFLSCGPQDLHGGWGNDGNHWNVTSECNAGCGCGPEVKYAPVCWLNGSTTFYSACHAGCTDSYSFPNGTSMYENCGCAGGGSVLDGSCPSDCGYSFTIFIVTQCITSFLGASGLSGNVLIHLRCVDEADKALTLAISSLLNALLGFIPGPAIFGMLLDSACMVWGQICGRKGNCWLYDGEALRYRLNFTAGAFIFVGLVMDVFVWYYCKDVQMYDVDEPDRCMLKKNKVSDSETSSSEQIS